MRCEKIENFQKKERIDYILKAGFKDGLIDLVRDYKHEYQKRLATSFEEIKRGFKDLDKSKELDIDLIQKSFLKTISRHF